MVLFVSIQFVMVDVKFIVYGKLHYTTQDGCQYSGVR